MSFLVLAESWQKKKGDNSMKQSTKNIVLIILSVILFPIALFEYFLLFWYWAGDGIFMLISVPVFFGAFLLPQLLFCIKAKEKKILRIFLIYSMVLLTPVLAVCASYLLAWLCGVTVVVM